MIFQEVVTTQHSAMLCDRADVCVGVRVCVRVDVCVGVCTLRYHGCPSAQAGCCGELVCSDSTYVCLLRKD